VISDLDVVLNLPRKWREIVGRTFSPIQIYNHPSTAINSEMSYLQALEHAYSKVTALEPLPPTSSPGTTNTYRKMLERANQYTGQILAHLGGISVASDRDSDEEEVFALNDGSGEWGWSFRYIYMRIYSTLLSTR
jgi:hypothetical protein